MAGTPAGVSGEEAYLAGGVGEEVSDEQWVGGAAEAGEDGGSVGAGVVVVEGEDGGFTGSAAVDDAFAGAGVAGGVFGEGAEGDGEGSVEDEADGAFVVVGDEQDDGAGEVGVAEAFGGDEKLAAEGVGHGAGSMVSLCVGLGGGRGV